MEEGRKTFATNGSNAGKHLEKKISELVGVIGEQGVHIGILKSIEYDIDLYKVVGILQGL